MEMIYHDEIKGEADIATAETYQCPTCGIVKSKLSSKDYFSKFRAKLIDGPVSLDDASALDETIALGKNRVILRLQKCSLCNLLVLTRRKERHF